MKESSRGSQGYIIRIRRPSFKAEIRMNWAVKEWKTDVCYTAKGQSIDLTITSLYLSLVVFLFLELSVPHCLCLRLNETLSIFDYFPTLSFSSLTPSFSLSILLSLSLSQYLCLSFSQRHVLYSSVLCSSVLYASVLYSSLSHSQSLPVEFTIPLCNSPPKRFWYPPIFLLNLLSRRPPVRPPALLICVYEQHLLYLYVSAAYFIRNVLCSMKYYISNLIFFDFQTVQSLA